MDVAERVAENMALTELVNSRSYGSLTERQKSEMKKRRSKRPKVVYKNSCACVCASCNSAT